MIAPFVSCSNPSPVPTWPGLWPFYTEKLGFVKTDDSAESGEVTLGHRFLSVVSSEVSGGGALRLEPSGEQLITAGWLGDKNGHEVYKYERRPPGIGIRRVASSRWS